MSIAIKAVFDPLRTIAFGDISGAYAPLGTPFAHPVRLMEIFNMTDANMLFTTKETEDQWFLPVGGFIIRDFCANKTIDQGFTLPVGTQISVKDMGTAATMGAVYISTVYASTGY